MIYLVLFAVVIAFIIAFCADRDNSALRSRIAVLESILSDTGSRANTANAKRYQNHVAFNKLARKSKQRGKTIFKREQLISQLKAEVKVLSDTNAKWAEKQNELLGQNTKLLKTIGEQETEIAKLKQREQNCPYERAGKNRITYCMKEKK